jgi:hypothetical protein
MGGSALAESFKNGIAEEAKVRAVLEREGYRFFAPTEQEDRREDIDLWVEIGLQRVPVSIKAQHKGLEYGNIYMELESQLTKSGRWVESWYHYGRSDAYAIIQGDTVRFYWKKDIQDYVLANGWLRVRSLSKKYRDTQGGNYVYQDARCGYLDTMAVKPFMTFEV